jgi:hypothetical protein
LETISKGECLFVGIDDPVLIQTHHTFGVWIRLAGLGKFVRNWGWIVTNGLELVEVFATEIEAEAGAGGVGQGKAATRLWRPVMPVEWERMRGAGCPRIFGRSMATRSWGGSIISRPGQSAVACKEFDHAL